MLGNLAFILFGLVLLLKGWQEVLVKEIFVTLMQLVGKGERWT